MGEPCRQRSERREPVRAAELSLELMNDRDILEDAYDS